MPKNMIVRLGVDASDFKKKMAQAGVDAENASKKIKKSMTMSEVGSEVRAIMGWGNSSSAGITGAINARNVDAARSQLNTLKAYRDQLAALGFDDLQFGEVSERIKVLEFELSSYEETLNRTADAEQTAAKAASNLGTQSQKVRASASEAETGLKKIGDSASKSDIKLAKMVRSIRNISVVSFGLRIARGLFGELGTIVRQYVSENAALQAQTDALKNSFGQALAPAINVVTNALSVLMPYVVGVSNAIGQLLGALGGGWANVATQANGATAAIKGAGGAQAELKRSLYGFDEITKLNEKSGGGGGGGASTTMQITPITPEWLDNFVAEMKTKIQAQDWAGVGNIIIEGISSGLGAAVGGITKLARDKIWKPFVNFLSEYTQKADDLFGVGNNIWWGIGLGISDALRSIGPWTKEHIFAPFVNGFKNVFQIHSPARNPEIVDAGKNIMLGILNGILEPWKDPVGWIKEHILDPLAAAFTGAGSWGNASVDVQANLTSWKDKLKNKAVDFQSRLTTWKESLKNKVVDFQSNFTTWKDSLKNKTIQNGTVNVSTLKDNVSNKTFGGGTTVITSFVDQVKNKLFGGGSATITSFIDQVRDKVFGGGTVVVDAVVDNVDNPTVSDGTMEVTNTYDKIPANARKLDKFNAELHAWEDNIDPNDKNLSLKAKIQKGWSGSLEASLGVDNLYSTLHVEVPEVKVKWNTSYSEPGNNNSTSVNVPKYELLYPTTKNAIGAIFTGASLLGRVGGRDQIAGEAGREALLPLDRHTWWMDDIADRVEARIGGSSAVADRPIQVNLVVDGKVLANTVVRNVNAQARATGRNPLAAYI